MTEGSNDLLQLVQRKLAEKESEVLELRQRLEDQSGAVDVSELQDQLAERDQVIRAQMEQINEMGEQVDALETKLANDGGGAGTSHEDQSELVKEQEEVIREQMEQILDLSEKLENNDKDASEDLTSGEKDEVIREQMGQIVEYEERIEELEKQLSELK